MNRLVKLSLLSIVVVSVVSSTIQVLNGTLGQKNEISDQSKTVVGAAVPFAAEESRDPAPVKVKELKTLKLNPKRTVVINEEIGYFSERFAEDISNMPDSKEPIVILIDSPGGSVFVGEKIVSAIEAAKSDVYTVCIGMCASMAAVIHQYGTKRLATDRSVLMLHDAAGGLQGRVSEMASMLTMIRRKLEKVNHYIANRSKISFDELIRLESSNYWVDAEDAMEKGLVDGLVRIKK